MKQPHDIRTKLRRQIELVGLCTDPSEKISIIDLSILFDCEELTIKRDLQDLRSSGIDIHSVPRKGVCISGGLSPKKLEDLILQYSVLSSPGDTDKATKTLIRKQKTDALRNIVTIQRCIDQNNAVSFAYEKTSGSISPAREVFPARLFRSDGQWRLIAQDDGLLKQFLLAKMSSIRPTATAFKPLADEEIDALFKHSFRSFLGTETLRVRLHLSQRWAEIVKPRQIFERAEIREREDKSIELTFLVNNLEEIAGWVASRGEGVTVLEPVKLREMVIELARGSLNNYDHRLSR